MESTNNISAEIKQLKQILLDHNSLLHTNTVLLGQLSSQIDNLNQISELFNNLSTNLTNIKDVTNTNNNQIQHLLKYYQEFNSEIKNILLWTIMMRKKKKNLIHY